MVAYRDAANLIRHKYSIHPRDALIINNMYIYYCINIVIKADVTREIKPFITGRGGYRAVQEGRFLTFLYIP